MSFIFYSYKSDILIQCDLLSFKKIYSYSNESQKYSTYNKLSNIIVMTYYS